MLERLKQFFRCGVVKKKHGSCNAFRVRKFQDFVLIILPFFDQYPLQTRKVNDFVLFKEVVSLMQRKEHLNEKGIEKIGEIANKMNRKGNHSPQNTCAYQNFVLVSPQ